MKKIYIVLLVLVGCASLRPNVNSCYIYKVENDNPFGIDYIDTIKILDTKEGYVKYSGKNGINSMKIQAYAEYIECPCKD